MVSDNAYSSLAEFFSQTGEKQQDIAALVGCHPITLSRIVNGKQTPNLRLAIRISEATGVPVKSILREEDAVA